MGLDVRHESSDVLVATMYLLEIQLVEALGEHDAVTKEAALDLLRCNSASAAAAIRALSDEKLDRAAPVSLNSDAPLTCQFMLEDHAVRHSYHHLASLQGAIKAVS